MEIAVRYDDFALAEAFTISRGTKTAAEVVTVTVTDGPQRGHGECVPYARYGETRGSVTAQIKGLPERFDRAELQDLLPAGAARNAVDCALWDLEAKRAGQRVWQLAGLPPPVPQITAFTLSLDTPGEMCRAAERHRHRPLLKIKLGTDDDLARLQAVREGAPYSRLIVDANEGWTAEAYARLAPHLSALRVDLVEQPFPAGDDDVLRALDRPVPICADESCHDRASLPLLSGKYDAINIKLDKTGGLTEALALREAALAQGFAIMVGCMVGSSLAMAPAVLVAQDAAFTDLDGPLLLSEDRAHPLAFDECGVHPPEKDLWG